MVFRCKLKITQRKRPRGHQSLRSCCPDRSSNPSSKQRLANQSEFHITICGQWTHHGILTLRRNDRPWAKSFGCVCVRKMRNFFAAKRSGENSRLRSICIGRVFLAWFSVCVAVHSKLSGNSRFAFQAIKREGEERKRVRRRQHWWFEKIEETAATNPPVPVLQLRSSRVLVWSRISANNNIRQFCTAKSRLAIRSQIFWCSRITTSLVQIQNKSRERS